MDPMISEWCESHLGSPATTVLFEIQQQSRVTGVRLQDGREVVIKVRAPAQRLVACARVHRYAWERGFPCPEPLAGPAAFGDITATAETLVRGGEALEGEDVAPLYAETLARFVSLVPPDAVTATLEPPPYWMQWDHSLVRTWPPDPNVDLNGSDGPDWLERAGRVARERLRDSGALPEAIGHGDWERQNLRWQDRDLHVVHDWDSVVRRPEALVAGMTSLIYPSGTGERNNDAASIAGSEAFLDAYQTARGREFTDEETELAWAAGLWIGAWKAKKALLFGDRRVAAELAEQVSERLRRAGG